MVKGNGPCNAQRVAHRKAAHDDGAWVREAATAHAAKSAARARERCTDWPLYEVFLRASAGSTTCTSGRCTPPTPRWRCTTPATSTPAATRASASGSSPPTDITASSPDEKDPFFAPAGDKVYRHPTFYDIPDDVPHM